MLNVPFRAALLFDIVLSCVWSAAVARWSVRAPLPVRPAGWLTRVRPWERRGRTYEGLGIRRWKGHLPDFAPRFGGEAKRLKGRREQADLTHFVALTRRAETAHWLMQLALPVDAVVRSGLVLVPMVGVAVIANAPCIVTQRYNRARLEAFLTRTGPRRRRLLVDDW